MKKIILCCVIVLCCLGAFCLAKTLLQKSWEKELEFFIDEFGNTSEKAYLMSPVGTGIFSDSENLESPFYWRLYITEEMRIYEDFGTSFSHLGPKIYLLLTTDKSNTDKNLSSLRRRAKTDLENDNYYCNDSWISLYTINDNGEQNLYYIWDGIPKIGLIEIPYYDQCVEILTSLFQNNSLSFVLCEDGYENGGDFVFNFGTINTSGLSEKYQNLFGCIEHNSDAEHSAITKPETCTSTGIMTRTCSVCEKIIEIREIPVKDHTSDNGVITREPTCIASGVETYSCIDCGETLKTIFTKKTDHTYINYKCSYCGIWGKGPTGGYVFYDCDEDNTIEDPDGADDLRSDICGWRFLEAAPEDIKGNYIFGHYIGSNNEDVPTVLTADTSTDIGTGKSNTEKLVKAMGDSSMAKKYAARICYVVKLIDKSKNEEIIYDDWFLPSKDELNLMYVNLRKQGLGSFSNSGYLSSSEADSNSAWTQNFYVWGRGRQEAQNKETPLRIRPVRSFN